MNIWELTGAFKALLDMAENEEIDIETFTDTMESLEYDLATKADNYARIIRTLTGNAEVIDAEIKRLLKMKNGLLNKADVLKKNLETAMIATGNKKIKTDFFNFSIAKNPAKLIVTGDVPQEFLIPQEPKVNNAAIKEMLKNGEECDFAKLEQSESIRIK